MTGTTQGIVATDGGDAVVVTDIDAVGGGDRFTGGQVLAQVVVEAESPIDGAAVGARQAAYTSPRESEGVCQILQGCGQGG